MDRLRFEELVRQAIDRLPQELAEKLENVDVVVQDLPYPEQSRRMGTGHRYMLLGLYEGVPLTRRGQFYGMVLPDKITLFQTNIERKCGGDAGRIIREITAVVRHEIAHHFGISDERLKQIEKRDG